MSKISRREMLQRSLLGAAATVLELPGAGSDETPPDPIRLARQRLRSIMPTRQQVADFITPQHDATVVLASRGWTYDSDLGWRAGPFNQGARACAATLSLKCPGVFDSTLRGA